MSASLSRIATPADTTLMNKRIIATVLGAAALAVPAAAVADSDHKRPGKQIEKGKGKGKAKKAKKVMFVFKGTFTAPGTVTVDAGNAHVRKGGYVGEAVAFDFDDAKVVVADTNADGKRDVADVQDGDRVLVQARMLKRTKYIAPVEDDAPEAETAGDEVAGGESGGSEAIVARKLIDRTHPPVEDAEDE
jgi:hypothetical protein